MQHRETKVIPIGDFIEQGVCNDQHLVWDSSFTILGVKVDNRLEKLSENFDIIFQRVNGLIHK